MNLEIKREAMKVLDGSLMLCGAERLAYLDRACGRDAVLRSEVEALLAVEVAATEWLDEPLLRLPREEVPELRAGDWVGRFQIKEEIGHGGMGTVYLAEHPDFGTRVAVKVLRPDRSKGEDLVRFQQEQEILARLDHANVVRPLERGWTGKGTPFLVMDFIEGVAIDRYCEQQGLSTEDRLRLFCKVCDTVNFAHQSLIVHRDLKPANILITDQGEPKLLDFGIAGLLEASPYSIDSEALREKTATAFLGTLRYASPEQVSGGDVLRTASDVYSLGVILYELLTGHRPYRQQESSFVELSRAICEETPEKPSTSVGAAQAGGNGAGRRPRSGGELRSRLAGDLDAIVLKALDKDPDARYASPAQLAEDVRLHLRDFPVIAQDHTFGYLAGKFWRRHKWAIVASSVFFFMIFSFAGGMTWMWEREREARKEQEQAFFVADYIVKLFQVHDVATAGEGITARRLLDDGVPFLEEARRLEELSPEAKSRLEEQLPEDLPGLMGAFGWAYYGLGSFADADKWLSESVERRRAAPPDDDLVFGLFRLAAARREQGNEADAQVLETEASSVVQSGDVDGKRLAQGLGSLGFFLESRGDLRTAVAVYDASLTVKRRIFGRNASLAIGLGNRAALLIELGRFEEAEAGLREAYDIWLEVEGPGSADVAMAQNNLAVLLRDWGASAPDLQATAWPEAERLFRDSLATRIKLSGVDGASVAVVSNGLATLLRMRGELPEAGTLYEDALRIFRQTHGEHSRAVGIVLKNRALWFQAAGQPIAAEATARRAAAILESLLGPDDWRTAEAESILGGCLLDLGRGSEAEPLLRHSLAVIEAEKGEHGRLSSDARDRLARFAAAKSSP